MAPPHLRPCHTQSARESITFTFRYLIPKREQPSAADELHATRAEELTVLGRRFRIVRVENLLRCAPTVPNHPAPLTTTPNPACGGLPTAPRTRAR